MYVVDIKKEIKFLRRNLSVVMYCSSGAMYYNNAMLILLIEAYIPTTTSSTRQVHIEY